MTYRHAYVQLALNKRKSAVVEKAPACEEVNLDQENLTRFRNLVSNPDKVVMEDSAHANDPTWEKLLQFEKIRPGLQPYY
jgi:hypothetical protein